MERKRYSILFFIKRTRLLSNGQAPIRLRITYDKQKEELQLKRSIPVELWSQDKEKSNGKDRLSAELNSYIDVVRVKLLQIHQDLELKGQLISAKTIKDIFLGKDGTSNRTLYSVFKDHNDRCRQLIGTDYSPITVKRYDNCLKYLMETVVRYRNKKDILLREVDRELVNNFEFYMKTEKNCCQNATIRYLKCFKKVINMTIANEWISRNPFAGIKFHEDEVNKEFLTQEEINKVYAKEFEIKRLDLIRDIFIFCCFTGLAFVDVLNLRDEHITQDNEGNLWIRKTREKTRNMCNIPLLRIPLQILDKYRFHPQCKTKGVLLPVMCNQKMNSYLKEIADLCGIKKNLTMHTARHTFASVVALANNVSLENVAKMLGHSNTKMTQHYAKVMDSSILRDMQKVDEKVGCF